MPEGPLVVVYAFATGPEADMAKSALEAAGIDAMIRADSAGGVTPHLAWSSGGYKLLVREEDEDTAREVLQLDEDEDEEE
jgi:Putative prokaryotic signal transducing protein